jgi:hypothetical protein
VSLLLLLAAAATHVPPDLATAVAAYDKAQIDSNRAELERWLADDYLLVNSSGVVESKAQLIADTPRPASIWSRSPSSSRSRRCGRTAP